MKMKNPVPRANGATFLTALLIGLIGMSYQTRAAESEHKGFFFDSQRKQYYSNSTPSFSIRPVGENAYLERIEYSINGSEFSNYSGKLKFDKEGVHTIRFRAVDPVLNWSPVQTFRLHVDLTPPVSSFSWNGPQFQSGGKLFVTSKSRLLLNTNDNLSGVRQTLWRDSSGTPKAAGSALAFPKEGPHSIEIAAIDRVGNQEKWKRIEFTVDNTAPQTKSRIVGISHTHKDTIYLNSQSMIELESVDHGAGVEKIEFQINGGPVTTYSQPIMVSSGETLLRYRGVDHVDNSEPWQALKVYQDTQPPLLGLNEVGRHFSVSGKIYARPGFALKTSAIDHESGLASIEVTRNGKSYEKATTTQYVFNEPGEYRFNIRAVDHVGNVSEGNPHTIVIDDQPPVSAYSASERLVPEGSLFLSGLPNRISINADDQGVGLSHIEISYDGKSFVKLNESIDLATWRSPKNTLYYRAVDRLGNVEKAKAVQIRVLTQAPKVDLFVENGDLPNVPLSELMKRESGGSEPARKPASKQPKK